MTRLSLRGVGKRYPRATRPALNEIDLDVEPGEVLGVVGDSGSGKTTLLRVIAGLETLTAGEVVLDGAVVSTPRAALPPEQRDVGLVFQDYALFPHLTVEDNIGYGLHRMKRADRAARVGEILELIDMTGFGARYPHELSGGQQQRVALARALAPDPAIILLDEPFSNLDVSLKDELRGEVSRILRASGTTALVVVHDAEDVLALADRVAILRGGELWQVGTPRALYERPRDEYVARFFGPTNIIPAVARDGVFDTPLGEVVSPLATGEGVTVLLSVRPSDIEPVDGGVTAMVRRAGYRGSCIEFTAALRTSDGDAIEVVGQAPVSSGIAAGQQVSLGVRRNSAQVLDG